MFVNQNLHSHLPPTTATMRPHPLDRLASGGRSNIPSWRVMMMGAVVTVVVIIMYLRSGSSSQTYYKGVSTATVGGADTFEYKMYFTHDIDGKPQRISPWHHIPLRAEGEDDYYTFVCEVPKGATAKMEINKETPLNPIIQDIKKEKLRYYHSPSLVNYGAFPQTWEDPEYKDADVDLLGDNDPLDVVDIGAQVATVGEVYQVRVLGALGMVDDGEMDWKIVVVRKGDDLDGTVDDLDEAPKSVLDRVEELRIWFRDYKIPDGKPANKFAFDNKPIGKAHSERVIKRCGEHWQTLVKKGQHDTFWLPTHGTDDDDAE